MNQCYGNIAPKTFWGRLVCIAYSVLGIPLMLLCLANLGDILADMFRFIYTKVCCCGCCRKKKDKNKVDAIDDQDGSGKGRPSTPEAWKNQYANQQKLAAAGKGGPVVVDDHDDEDEDDEDETASVPLTITMLIILVYVIVAALLFQLIEGYEFMEACYFTFITVSTIGFGDIVPGSASFDKDSDNWVILGSSLFLLLGMAIISMCFSLIQEEIVSKFRWLGEKMGIVDHSKGEGEDGENAEGEDNGQRKIQSATPGKRKLRGTTPQPKRQPIPEAKIYPGSKSPAVHHPPPKAAMPAPAKALPGKTQPPAAAAKAGAPPSKTPDDQSTNSRPSSNNTNSTDLGSNPGQVPEA